MSFHIDNRKDKCSKCGSINRAFRRLTPEGYSYLECADCGHNNRPPPPLQGGYFSSVNIPEHNLF